MIPIPSLRPVFETLRVIEQRAGQAIAQELDLMIQTVLNLRPQTSLEDRAYADALLLKLDGLRSTQLVKQPSCAEASAVYANPVQVEGIAIPQGDSPIEPARHSVHLYSPKSGYLKDIVIVEGFMAAVGIFHERVSTAVDCLVEATWSHGQVVRGRLTARTMLGVVVAVIQPDDHISAQEQRKVEDPGATLLLTHTPCRFVAQAA